MYQIPVKSYFKSFNPMRAFVLALCLCWAGSVSAQRENISLGPMIGGSYSTLTNTPQGVQTNYKFGPSAGVFVNYSIKEHFGLTANVLYTRLGTDYESFNNNTNGAFKLNLDYIHVPVLATYYFGNDMGPGAIRPKLFLGPAVSFMVGNNGLINDNFQKIDVGATGGVGVNIGLAKQQWINVDLRYNLGFNQVYKNIPDRKDMSNQWFSLTVGYSFPVGQYDKGSNKFSGRR
ncbi:hypothetical protein BWI97_14665 [Siphonobacter sp. BAB-5405]|nr:hypothetical protein BWI97_14665 [Siphonobacter sp. BAB-5405]